MKRMIIIFLLLGGVCFGINNTAIFVKIYTAWKDGGYTEQQIKDATDDQVIDHANLTEAEAYQYRKYKNLIKRNAKAKIKAIKKAARRTTIIIPDLTAIIVKLKADGLTTAQAKAELLEIAQEELK
jgi:5-bromo-4-chloroindolyl phosphate hydrolysis protein